MSRYCAKSDRSVRLEWLRKHRSIWQDGSTEGLWDAATKMKEAGLYSGSTGTRDIVTGLKGLVKQLEKEDAEGNHS